VKEKTIEKIRATLEKAGVEFIAADNGGPGVRPAESKEESEMKMKFAAAGAGW
jgi:hypothetical protein